jgi:hypothetical protein
MNEQDSLNQHTSNKETAPKVWRAILFFTLACKTDGSSTKIRRWRIARKASTRAVSLSGICAERLDKLARGRC